MESLTQILTAAQSLFPPPWRLGLLLAGGLALYLACRRGISLLRRRDFPYERLSLFTRAELRFYLDLRKAADRCGLVVFAKVRIADIIGVKKGSRNHGSWAGKIRSKHADFVLCHPDTLETAMVVELDDQSHQRKDRRERDAFVDKAYRAAGIPILHLWEYTPDSLEKQLRRELKSCSRP